MSGVEREEGSRKSREVGLLHYAQIVQQQQHLICGNEQLSNPVNMFDIKKTIFSFKNYCFPQWFDCD